MTLPLEQQPAGLMLTARRLAGANKLEADDWALVAQTTVRSRNRGKRPRNGHIRREPTALSRLTRVFQRKCLEYQIVAFSPMTLTLPAASETDHLRADIPPSLRLCSGYVMCAGSDASKLVYAEQYA